MKKSDKTLLIILLPIVAVLTILMTFAPAVSPFRWPDPRLGTPGMPHTIMTANQLLEFAEAVNNGNDFQGVYVALGRNINLSGIEWVPIGTVGHPFMGHFDGRGLAVRNLTMDGLYRQRINEDTGLFGVNRGTIRNLRVENISINTGGVNAAVLRSVGGICGYNWGEIINCFTSGNISITSSGTAYAGGLVGFNHGTSSGVHGNIRDSSSAVNVFSSGGGLGGGVAGGLVGQNGATITTSFASGTVEASSNAGGLVGRNLGRIENTFATGNIIGIPGRSARAGGLVGSNDATIRYSFASGNIESSFVAGGLVGNYSNSIDHVFATGNVKVISNDGFSSAGGLVGMGSYWRVAGYRYEGQTFDVNGVTTPNNTLGSPVSLMQLNSPSFYIDTLGWSKEVWDFSRLDFEAGIMPRLRR